MTFRVRTALVVLALTAVTMGGAFAIVWERFVASQRRQLDEALLLVARREAAEAAAGQLEFTDAPGPSANAVGPLPKYGVLYGIHGRPLSMTSNFATTPAMPRLVPFERGFDLDHDSVPLRGVVVGVSGTGMRVLLATPRADLEDDAAILARAMAVAVGVGCAWAAIVAFGVATRLTREHRIVGDVARRVASGDTSARVAFRTSDSDLQRLADDLNAMIERLVGLVAVQDRFVSHAAHELRTPLTSLRIELEHALRTASERAEFEAALRGGLESAKRLTDLAEDLLQLARVETSRIHANTALEDSLADAVADVAPLGRQRDVFIYVRPIQASIRAERRGLSRLFRNVLENAVRFSPPTRRVEVDCAAEDGRVVVTITDDGPGIGAEDEERIFEPFTRGTRDDGEGTGLGLSIARGLARSFGGDVTARAGSSGLFIISLPASTGEARSGT